MCTQLCTFDEEGIVRISSGVLLRLEERVKVPEGALDKIVGWHLCEPEEGGMGGREGGREGRST